jgi:hypothetical protein
LIRALSLASYWGKALSRSFLPAFQGHGVVVGFADVDADEYVDGVVVVNHGAPHSLSRPVRGGIG